MSDLPNFSSHGYQVKRQLGHNHTGGRITYLAIERKTRQPVVIKQFQFANIGSEWSGYDAYVREIEVLRGLNHAGIPRYLDCFETPTGLCLVQEYKKARSLAAARSFEPAEIKKIATSLLQILMYLQNLLPLVIHRDIKPENILVDENINVYLVDFGFARVGEGVGVSSMVKGSAGFMPPEQLFNLQLTAASDLYSVGATLVCLLTGIKSTEITNLIDDNYRLNFRDFVPKLSLRWIEWLEKMVQLKPKDRFPNAAAALEALKPIYVVRTPEVKLSQSSLEFYPKKLGEKLTQTITVSNPIPETVLEGRWEVAPHESDPPHTTDTHRWISFHPATFESNRFNCKITVNTRHLMAGTTYQREVLLHTNTLLETQVLRVEVQTAPIRMKSKQLPYLSLALLVVLAAAGAWSEAAAWSNIVAKFGLMGLLVAALVTGFVAAVGAATAFVGKGIGVLAAKVVSRFKAKLQVDVAVAGLVAGLAALFVAKFGADFRAMNAAIAAFAAVDVVVFLAGFEAAGVAESSSKRGFSTRLAIVISLLATTLGFSLGLGCQLGFLNPFVKAGILVAGLPLGIMVLYPPLERARLIANYRRSERHLIKP